MNTSKPSRRISGEVKQKSPQDSSAKRSEADKAIAAKRSSNALLCSAAGTVPEVEFFLNPKQKQVDRKYQHRALRLPFFTTSAQRLPDVTD
jgi:hypothetical protein